MSDIVREQGERVTDTVADVVKERLFGAPATQTQPAPVVDDDIEIHVVGRENG